jgi:hypothetical protein
VRWVESPDIARRRALARNLPMQMAPYEDDEILAKYPSLPQADEMITEGKGFPAVTDSIRKYAFTSLDMGRSAASFLLRAAILALIVVLVRVMDAGRDA